MPETIDLGEVKVNPKYLDPIKPEEGIGVGDYGRALSSGALGLGSSLAGAAEFVLDPEPDSAIRDTRKYLGDASEGELKKMSPRAQRAISAGVLPNSEGSDIFDDDVSAGGALGLKIASSLPSMLLTMVPGGVVARAVRTAGYGVEAAAAAGTAAGGVASGAQMGGDVFNDIVKGIEDMPDDKLQAESPMYKDLRKSYDEKTARKVLRDEAVGNKPYIMGALGAALEKVGAGAAVAKSAAGMEGKGLLKGALHTGREEALTESAQNAVQEGLTQTGNIEAGTQKDYDPYKAANSVAEGAIVGGLMGAGVGAVTGTGKGALSKLKTPSAGDAPTVDPAVDAAMTDQDVADTSSSATDTARQGLIDTGNMLDQQAASLNEAKNAKGAKGEAFKKRNRGKNAVVAPDPAVDAAMQAEPGNAVNPSDIVEKITGNVGGTVQAPEEVTTVVNPEVTPEASPDAFQAQNEFEADPDAELPVRAPQDTPRIAEDAPGQAPATQEVVTPPVETTAAGDPSEATQTPSSEVVDLGAVPAPPREATPRVLRSDVSLEAEPTKAPEKPAQRISAKERERIARGEGDAVALSQNPDDWKKQGDRVRVYKLADAEKAAAETEGREVKPWAADVLAARGKTVGNSEKSRAAREQYLRGRQALADSVNERIQSGEARRETTEEATQRKAAEKRIGDAKIVADILKNAPMPTQALNGAPKAVRQYAKLVLDVAKRAKVAIPDTVTKDTDPHLIYLKNAQEVAKEGSTRATHEQFIADDFFLRKGAGDELSERRSAQALKSEQSYDETPRKEVDVREGADTSEEYDAAGAREEAAQEPEAYEDATSTPRLESAERVSEELAPSTGPTVTVGVDKGGQFKVEARKNRSVAQAARQVDRKPSDAQKEAGNYRKGHTSVLGMDVAIENPKGSIRSGKSDDGREWSVKMPAHYGYIKGTVGADGDHVDVYLGPDAGRDQWASGGTVYVVNQQNLDGSFDEHKAMLGYNSRREALDAYKAGFSDGKGAQRIQSVAEMTTQRFRVWARNPGKGPAPTQYVGLPAARQRSPDDERAARELEQIFGKSTATTEFDLNDGLTRVVSPRSGVAVVPAMTRSLGAMLREVNLSTLSAANTIINTHFAKRLREMVADTPVHVVSHADMVGLTQDMLADGRMSATPLGYYEPGGRYIVLDESSLTSEAALAHLLIHEGLHAAFLDTIEQSAPTKELIRQMMNFVTDATGKTARDVYGLTNEHEFISEAFSSSKFQELLQSIPSPVSFREGLGKLGTLWEMFVATVRRVLGMPKGQETLLDGALRVGAILTNVRSDLSQHVPSSPRAMDPLAAHSVLQDHIRDGLSDRGRAVSGGAQRTVLRVQTMDQIRQGYRDLFQYRKEDGSWGSYLDDVVRGMQRQRPFVDASRERGEHFAQRFVELLRSNPKVAQASAVLRTDITMANINVLMGNPTRDKLVAANPHIFGQNGKGDIAASWQSAAQAESLQRRFSELPAQVQEQMLEEAKYFRDTQNDTTRKLVSNILDTSDAPISSVERDRLTTKVMAGTLDEDDATKLNNRTLFNALQNAKELRVIKGMYFPLMRHGDFVVRTTDDIGDTMGGKEVEPGVVEFRAPKDKAARKAANNYAKSTGLVVTRVAKAYYDPTTGERIKASDADASSVVGYRVSVQKEGVHFFDTRTDAERFIRETKASREHTKVSDTLVRHDLEARGDLHSSQLSALVKAVNARDDVPEAQRKMMATAIGQAAVRLMSGNRIQQKSLPRKRVQGASNEYARNVLSYATSASNYLGKLNFMPGVRTALKGMEDVKSDRYTPDSAARDNVYQEISNRIDANDMGLNQPGKAMRTLFTLSYMGKLFSPAHSVINATQPIMVTYPILAGRHGAASSAIELSRAFNNVGAFAQFGSGVANTVRAARQWANAALDTTDVLASIRKNLSKQSDGTALNQMLDEFVSRGAIDKDAGLEIASAVLAGAGRGGTALAKMDRIARQAPGAVEAVNRAVSGVAAYRLAVKSMSHEAAVQYAFDTVMASQGDYSAMNAAPLFNNKALRPFLQFKKYGQMMTHLYAGMIYRTFKGATKEDRKIAAKQFGNLLAVQTLVAGALSIPGLELAKMGFVLAAALGVGDGWEDFERKLRGLTEEAIGKPWSEMVHKGILSRAIGVDLSSRLSLADLWTFGEPRKYNTAEIASWIGKQIIGAPGGTVLDAAEGARKAGEGDLAGAAARILPVKFIADFTKAGAGLLEGKMSPYDAGLKAVGFRSARQANKSEAVSDSIAARDKRSDERGRLTREYIGAATGAERAKVISRIRSFNKTATFRDKLSVKYLERRKERQKKEDAS